MKKPETIPWVANKYVNNWTFLILYAVCVGISISFYYSMCTVTSITREYDDAHRICHEVNIWRQSGGKSWDELMGSLSKSHDTANKLKIRCP